MTFLFSCCQSTLSSTIRYMCWKSRSGPLCQSPPLLSKFTNYKASVWVLCIITLNSHSNNFYAKIMTISKKLMAGQERGSLVITGERPWCSLAKQPHVHLPRIWSKSHKRNVKSNSCRCGLCRDWNCKINTKCWFLQIGRRVVQLWNMFQDSRAWILWKILGGEYESTVLYANLWTSFRLN